MADKKSRGQAAMGGKKSKSKSKSKKSKVHQIHLRRAHSGEMIATHKHLPDDDGLAPPDKEHVIPDGGLDQHAAEHLPAPEAAGVPAMGGGGAMPGM